MSFAELRQVWLPDGSPVPTLVEVLVWAATWGAYVVAETKPDCGGAEAARIAAHLSAVLAARRRRRLGADRVTTTSFDLATAAALGGAGTISGALIVAPQLHPEQASMRARASGLTDVHLHVTHVRKDPGIVARVRVRGLLVAVGIVDDAVEAREMAALGADIVCTDDPVGLVHRGCGPRCRSAVDGRLSPPRPGRSSTGSAAPRAAWGNRC